MRVLARQTRLGHPHGQTGGTAARAPRWVRRDGAVPVRRQRIGLRRRWAAGSREAQKTRGKEGKKDPKIRCVRRRGEGVVRPPLSSSFGSVVPHEHTNWVEPLCGCVAKLVACCSWVLHNGHN